MTEAVAFPQGKCQHSSPQKTDDAAAPQLGYTDLGAT